MDGPQEGREKQRVLRILWVLLFYIGGEVYLIIGIYVSWIF
jgi:hypothetical protein